MTALRNYLRALLQLNTKQVILYALYQAGLRLGYYRWLMKKTRAKKGVTESIFDFHQVLAIPKREVLRITLGKKGFQHLIDEANEIVSGKVRLFSSKPTPLTLSLPKDLHHWTEYEKGKEDLPLSHLSNPDVKFIWEPARFGWAFVLGRALHLSGDKRYSQAFWRYFDTFSQYNPPNLGPNWISSQEVALRLIAFVYFGHILIVSNCISEYRLLQLAKAIADHAARIPPTLVYARAQNNNHLLVEAAGLISAALVLPNHPEASHWLKLGQKWFRYGLDNQISNDGSYIQNSTNYHRLMLHVVMWVMTITTSHIGFIKTQNHGLPPPKDLVVNRFLSDDETISRNLVEKIRLSTEWLLNLVDESTGRVPNLGPNDGANILPLTICAFHDYRPVLQAATERFLGKRFFGEGPWDEMVLWLGGVENDLEDEETNVMYVDKNQYREHTSTHIQTDGSTEIQITTEPIRLSSGDLWAYLRVAKFGSRPGHADQLHLDLWWRGLNIALDPGTYLYNAPTPWNNSLVHTEVHNTITINKQDQMSLEGRFLWLDWAQAKILSYKSARDGSWKSITATHDGYHRLGVIHQRMVTVHRDLLWVIKDELIPYTKAISEQAEPYHLRLHWLLPDWQWTVNETNAKRYDLQLKSPYGKVGMSISVDTTQDSPFEANLQITQSGKLVYGIAEDDLVTLGWVSPTYGYKLPALSIAYHMDAILPVTIRSEFKFPNSRNSKIE